MTRKELIDEAMRRDHWRFGQAVFNIVNEIDPEFADSMRNTNCDPFYFDSRVERFISEAVKAGLIQQDK